MSANCVVSLTRLFWRADTSVSDFFSWCDQLGIGSLEAVEPVHVAGYIEQLGKSHSAPSVKQSLAAIRMLYDWLVVGQVTPANPASVVRGPKHVVKRGKTPILIQYTVGNAYWPNLGRQYNVSRLGARSRSLSWSSRQPIPARSKARAVQRVNADVRVIPLSMAV